MLPSDRHKSECQDHDCIHYWSDYYLLEILDPETLQPVPEGEWGEMVITTLCKEATPLIRYRTRDLTRKITPPCSCGNVFPMHDKILGRSDDMIILRGVNIYPGQVDEVLSAIPEVGSEYQLHLERKDDGKEYMTIRVEAAQGVDPERSEPIQGKLRKLVRSKILVSCNADICAYGDLPRYPGKAQRIFDTRDQ